MIDTIYAMASGPGRSGIAVVRVSGPSAKASLALFSKDNFQPRQAVLTKLIDPHTQSLIDHAIVIYFQPPRSYTGEDVVEYHIHGGKAVKESLLNALSQCQNHRMAEAGEFTRRAFENGRMDLTQAEAVADLIHAETEAQKQLALSQMGGALRDLYTDWSNELKKSLAYAEAQIDFGEDDLPEEEIKANIHPVLKKVAHQIQAHLDDDHRGEILRDGIKIAIIGAPNAGKSSLINALAKRDVAIVSDIPGTTRDILEVHLDLNGIPVKFYDTAGLRPEQLSTENKQDIIEAEGIKRALKIAKKADFKILLFDGSSGNLHAQTLEQYDDKSFIVINKSDLNTNINRNDYLFISSKTGENIDHFIKNVSRETSSLFEDLSHTPSLTRERHREALNNALSSINNALNENLTADLVSEDIRMAVRYIGKITGKVDVEDLLDIIFRDFCIGK